MSTNTCYPTDGAWARAQPVSEMQSQVQPRTPPQFEHINGSLKDKGRVNLHALCSECFKSVENKEKNKKGIFGRMRNIVG